MIGAILRGRRRGTAIVLVIIALAVLTSLAWSVPDSSAQRGKTRTVPSKPCRVGQIDRELLSPNPYGGQHPFSVAPTIVGCGRSSFGQVKLVAYDITRPAEFCFGVVLPRLGVMSGGECKKQNERWTALRCPSGFCSFGPDFGVGGGPKYGFQATIVSGVATVPLEGIEVVGRESALERRSTATVGNISGHLAAKFHQTEPFAVFGAALPCMAPKAFTVEGDDGVERLAATRLPYPELLKHPCHPPPPPKTP